MFDLTVQQRRGAALLCAVLLATPAMVRAQADPTAGIPKNLRCGGSRNISVTGTEALSGESTRLEYDFEDKYKGRGVDPAKPGGLGRTDAGQDAVAQFNQVANYLTCPANCAKSVAGPTLTLLPFGGGSASAGGRYQARVRATGAVDCALPAAAAVKGGVSLVNPGVATRPTLEKPSYTVGAKPSYLTPGPAAAAATPGGQMAAAIRSPANAAPAVVCPKGERAVVVAGRQTCVAAALAR